MLLKIFIKSPEGDIVKVNLPLSLVKAGLESGMLNVSGNDALEGIDFNAILLAAEKGVIGKLVEVQSAREGIVEIFIE